MNLDLDIEVKDLDLSPSAVRSRKRRRELLVRERQNKFRRLAAARETRLGFDMFYR